MPRTPGDPPHGIKRFRSRTHMCRCTTCKAAQAAYMKGYRHSHTRPAYVPKPKKDRALSDPPHGVRRYRNRRFLCRCDVCRTEASAKTQEERKARKCK